MPRPDALQMAASSIVFNLVWCILLEVLAKYLCTRSSCIGGKKVTNPDIYPLAVNASSSQFLFLPSPQASPKLNLL